MWFVCVCVWEGGGSWGAFVMIDKFNKRYCRCGFNSIGHSTFIKKVSINTAAKNIR